MTLKQIDKILNDFCNDHLMVEKYGSDFLEQIGNFATENEKYPIVFMTPSTNSPSLDLQNFSIEVRCLDIIQKDRENIITILSDTQQILNDIFLFLKDGINGGIDIPDAAPTMTPLNNDLLDYAAGWLIVIDLEVGSSNVCEIPLTTNI